MASHQEALDLIISIKRDIDKNRKIYEILPKILELSKILPDEKLEDICMLELSGYYETDKISSEKIDKYAKEVGRKRITQLDTGEKIFEKDYYPGSLIQIEGRIKELTGSTRGSASHHKNILLGRKSSIEAFFINRVEDIHKELKQYYPIKIIDNYLEDIMGKLEDLSDSLIDKIKSIYNNLYSNEDSDLINIPELCRKIIVELGNLLYPDEKTIEEDSKKYYKLQGGEKLEINDTDRNYKNKCISYIDYKVSSKTTKQLFTSDLDLIFDNIIKLSDFTSKLSHIREMKEEDKKPIISLAIRTIIFAGDLLYYY